jgi:hypothetical protein
MKAERKRLSPWKILGIAVGAALTAILLYHMLRILVTELP